MSLRLASTNTSSPARRASAITSANAATPAGPSCSKNAACGFTAGTSGATTSITAWQKRT
jgi:hypothetical protein